MLRLQSRGSRGSDVGCPEYNFYDLPLAPPRIIEAWSLERERYQQIIDRTLDYLPLPAGSTPPSPHHFYRFNEVVEAGDRLRYTWRWCTVRCISVDEEGWCLRLGAVSNREGEQLFRQQAMRSA